MKERIYNIYYPNIQQTIYGCIRLYTAVYSRIKLKLWTSKSGFLYTDNLGEMING